MGCAGAPFVSAARSADAAAKIAPSVVAVATQLEAGADPAIYNQGSVRADSQGRIQVYVHIDKITDAELATLSAKGLVRAVPSQMLHVVQGWVKPENLNALAALPFVTTITPPVYGYPQSKLEPQ